LKPDGLISGIFRRYNRLVVPGMRVDALKRVDDTSDIVHLQTKNITSHILGDAA
jgi:hypothetical protein